MSIVRCDRCDGHVDTDYDYVMYNEDENNFVCEGCMTNEELDNE